MSFFSFSQRLGNESSEVGGRNRRGYFWSMLQRRKWVWFHVLHSCILGGKWGVSTGTEAWKSQKQTQEAWKFMECVRAVRLTQPNSVRVWVCVCMCMCMWVSTHIQMCTHVGSRGSGGWWHKNSNGSHWAQVFTEKAHITRHLGRSSLEGWWGGSPQTETSPAF